jgi:DNA-binding transcriptional ArsR family regulator
MLNVKIPTSGELDLLFGALADATRRGIVNQLADGEQTVTELAARHPISLPAISRHLKVLERASIITRSKDGRLRRARLSPLSLASTATWLSQYEQLWSERLNRLDDLIAKEAGTSPEQPVFQIERETISKEGAP